MLVRKIADDDVQNSDASSQVGPAIRSQHVPCPATGLTPLLGTRIATDLLWSGQGVARAAVCFACPHVDAVEASNAAALKRVRRGIAQTKIKFNHNITQPASPATDPHTTQTHTRTGVVLRTIQKAMRLLAACLALLAAAATAAPHHHQHPSNMRLRKGTYVKSGGGLDVGWLDGVVNRLTGWVIQSIFGLE